MTRRPATRQRPNVIVTGGEYPAGLAAVRALRAAGYAPWAATVHHWSYAARSRATAGLVPVPWAARDPDGFGATLAAASSRLEARAVLPGSDLDMHVLSERRPTLPPAVAAGLPPPEVLELTTDKRRLTALAAAAGIASPPTVVLAAERVDDESALPFGYPVIVKTRRSAVPGEGGALAYFPSRRAGSPAELRELLHRLPERSGLVQPAIEGRLLTVNGVAWRGEPIRVVHKVADRVWPPGCGVVSHAVTTAPDRELGARVARLLRAIGWSGLFNLQLIEAQNDPLLIDFNPRIYHSLALAVGAGANLPAIWLDVLGRPAAAPAGAGEVGSYRHGLHFRSEEEDALALLARWREGRRWSALRALRPRRGTVHAVLSRSDPGPARTMLGNVRARWRQRRAGRLTSA